ncbi:MAG: RNA polymerase sigma factor [Bacteroidales bacterium]|nr:RNA polymerase sigma factor [Bacteroidales bacterium]
MGQHTEKEFIRQIIDGDTALFSVFVEKYAGKIFGMIHKIVQSKSESEDLTQEVFIKAFNNLKKYQGKSQFSTWLYSIAYNTAISATRKKKTIAPVISDSVLNAISDDKVDDLLDREDDEALLEELEKAIQQLNPEEKTLITLFYYSDKQVQEISEIMNISLSNVKTKLFRVRRKLFTLIKLNDDEDR